MKELKQGNLVLSRFWQYTLAFTIFISVVIVCCYFFFVKVSQPTEIEKTSSTDSHQGIRIFLNASFSSRSPKGQLNSKELFGVFNSSKKLTKNKKIRPNSTMIPPWVELFSFIFWKN